MTPLTADEITTLDEAWQTGSFAVVLDAVEELVDAHRDEAVVMADLAALDEARGGGWEDGYSAGLTDGMAEV